MTCGCGGSPAVWQPASEAEQQQGEQPTDPNERIAQQRHEAAARRVWPAEWTGQRQPEKV